MSKQGDSYGTLFSPFSSRLGQPGESSRRIATRKQCRRARHAHSRSQLTATRGMAAMSGPPLCWSSLYAHIGDIGTGWCVGHSTVPCPTECQQCIAGLATEPGRRSSRRGADVVILAEMLRSSHGNLRRQHKRQTLVLIDVNNDASTSMMYVHVALNGGGMDVRSPLDSDPCVR